MTNVLTWQNFHKHMPSHFSDKWGSWRESKVKLGLMEDPPTITTATKRSEQQTSVTSRVKRDCISFFVSLQEGFRYFKALLVGQVLVTPSTPNSLVISHIHICTHTHVWNNYDDRCRGRRWQQETRRKQLKLISSPKRCRLKLLMLPRIPRRIYINLCNAIHYVNQEQ